MAVSKALKLELNYQNNQQSLAKVKQELEHIFTASKVDLVGMGVGAGEKEIARVKQAAQQLHTILSRSFDVELGVTNIAKFREELDKSGTSLQNIYNELRKTGPEGEKAFRDMAASIATSNIQLQKTDGFLNKMAITLMNTIRWTLATNVLNAITGTLSDAVTYVERLDTSLNNIRVVTGASADDMKRFSKEANKAAQELGASTRDIAEGALIFYQQGDTDENAMYKAQVTQKLTNVSTDLNADEASEFMTAIWNGFQVNKRAALEGMQVYDEYADKLAAVAASTASNVTEQATAMAKVASAANLVGVGFDQLNAIMATTESVTRQAPETIGTAWRTIFSRMTDLKLGGVDEEGVSLGDVSGQLSGYGINILDETGELRELGKVIDEIGEKWGQWTKAQQVAVAELIAGKRQYNNVTALFQEWDTMYQTALETSETGVGKLQEMQDIYMESNAAIRQQFKTAGEELYSDLFDVDDINIVIKGATEIVKLIDGVIKSLGGAVPIFTAISGLLTQLVSQKFATGLGTILNNLQSSKLQLQNAREALQLVKEVQQINNLDENSQEILTYIDKFTTKQQYMNDEQKEMLRSLVEEKKAVQDLINDWNTLAKVQTDAAKKYGQSLTNEDLKLGGKSDNYKGWQDFVSSNQEKLNGLNTTLTEVTFKIDKMGEEALASGEDIKLLNDTLDSFGDDFHDERINALFTNILNGSGTTTDKIMELVQVTQKEVKELEDLEEKMKQMPQDAESYAMRAEAAGDGLKNLSRQMENAIKIDPIIKGVSAFAELASSIMVVSNSFDTLTNAESSATEKMQAIAGLGMSLVPLLNSFKQLTGITGGNGIINDFLNARAQQSKVPQLQNEKARETVAFNQAKEELEQLKIEYNIYHERRIKAEEEYNNLIQQQSENRRKQQEIQNKINETQAQWTKDGQKKNELLEREKRYEQEISKYNKIILSAKGNIGQWEKLIEKEKRKQVPNEQKIKEWTDKITAKKADQQAAEQKLTTLQRLRSNITAKIAKLQDSEIKDEQELNDLQEELNSLLAEENRLRLAAEVTDEKRKNATKEEEELLKGVNEAQSAFNSIEQNLGNINVELGKAGELGNSIFGAISAAIQGNWLEAITLGVIALVSALDLLTVSADEAKEQMKQAVEEADEARNKLSNLEEQKKANAEELQALKLSKDLTEEEKTRVKELKEEQELLNEKIKLQQKIVEEKENEEALTVNTAFELSQTGDIWQNIVNLGLNYLEILEQSNPYLALAHLQLEKTYELFQKVIDFISKIPGIDKIWKIDPTKDKSYNIFGQETISSQLREKFKSDEYTTADAADLEQFNVEDKLRQYEGARQKLAEAQRRFKQDNSAINKQLLDEAQENFDNINKSFVAFVNEWQDSYDKLTEENKKKYDKAFNFVKFDDDQLKTWYAQLETWEKYAENENISPTERAAFTNQINKLKELIAEREKLLEDEQKKEIEEEEEKEQKILDLKEEYYKKLYGEISPQQLSNEWGLELDEKDPFAPLINSAEDYATALKNVTSRAKTLQSAMDEMNENGEISYDTAQNLIDANADYADLLTIVNGKIQLKNTETQNEIDAIYDRLKIGAQDRYQRELEALTIAYQKEQVVELSKAISNNTKIQQNNARQDVLLANLEDEKINLEFDVNGKIKNFSGSTAANIQKVKEYIKEYNNLQSQDFQDLQDSLNGEVKLSAYNGKTYNEVLAEIKKSHQASLDLAEAAKASLTSEPKTEFKAQKGTRLSGLIDLDKARLDDLKNQIKEEYDSLKEYKNLIKDAIDSGDFEEARRLTEEMIEKAQNLQEDVSIAAKNTRQKQTEKYSLLRSLTPTILGSVTIDDFKKNINYYKDSITNAIKTSDFNLNSLIAATEDQDLIKQYYNKQLTEEEKEEVINKVLTWLESSFELVGTKIGEGSWAKDVWTGAQNIINEEAVTYIADIITKEYEKGIEQAQSNIEELNDKKSLLDDIDYLGKMEIDFDILSNYAEMQEALDKRREALEQLPKDSEEYRKAVKALEKDERALAKSIQSVNKDLENQVKTIRDAGIAAEDALYKALEDYLKKRKDDLEDEKDLIQDEIDKVDELNDKRKEGIEEAKEALDKYKDALQKAWDAEDAHNERQEKLRDRQEKAQQRATQLTAAASGDLSALANVQDLDEELQKIDEEFQEDVIKEIRDKFLEFIDAEKKGLDAQLDALEEQKELLEEQKDRLDDIIDELQKQYDLALKNGELAQIVAKMRAGESYTFLGTSFPSVEDMYNASLTEGDKARASYLKNLETFRETQQKGQTFWNNPDAWTQAIVDGTVEGYKKVLGYSTTGLDKNKLETVAPVSTQLISNTINMGSQITWGAKDLQIAGYDNATVANQGMAAALQSTDENVARIAEHVTNEDNKVTTVNVNVEKAVNVEGSIDKSNVGKETNAAKNAAYSLADVFAKQFKSQGYTTVSQKH